MVVPLAATLVTLLAFIGFGVTVVKVSSGATVSLVAVLVLVPVLPAVSLKVAVKVIVPSARPLTSMPDAVQLPDESTVPLKVLLVPLSLSVATIVTVEPISVVPVAVTFVSLWALMGSGVIEVIVPVATVSLVAVFVVSVELPRALLAVAVKVIVPSARVWTSMPATVQLPEVSTVAL